MANPVDKGTQVQRVRFQQNLTSRLENQGFHTIIPDGIYSGGTLSLSAGNVDVSPLICFVRDDTVGNETALRIETTTTYTLDGITEVTETTPYIVLNYEWTDSLNNYMDITTKAIGDLVGSDIIVGKATYVGGILQSTFDYSERKNSILNQEVVDFSQGLLTIGNDQDSSEVQIGAELGSGGKIVLKDSAGVTKTTIRSYQDSETQVSYEIGGVAIAKSLVDTGFSLDVAGKGQIRDLEVRSSTDQRGVLIADNANTQQWKIALRDSDGALLINNVTHSVTSVKIAPTTGILDLSSSLTVSASCTIDQNLSSNSNVTFNAITATGVMNPQAGIESDVTGYNIRFATFTGTTQSSGQLIINSVSTSILNNVIGATLVYQNGGNWFTYVNNTTSSLISLYPSLNQIVVNINRSDALPIRLIVFYAI